MTTNLRQLVKRSEIITNLYRSTHFFSDASVKDLFDTDKRKLINTVRPYTMLSWKELSQLYDAASSIHDEQIAGSVVECGVCNGGSAGITSALAASDPDRHVWL